MNIESGFAEVNGTSLYYETAGAGPSLVFIHGFSLDGRMWDDQFLPFAHHFRVTRYDLRGFGRSALPTDQPYAHVDDLQALLHSLRIEETHLVGLSLGGAIAIDFALSFPNMVARLVLADAVLGGFQWSAEWDATVIPIWRYGRQNDITTARQLWLAHPLFKSALANDHASAPLMQMVTEYSGWHWQDRNPERHLEPPAIQRLTEIQAPTLVLIGENDLPDFQTVANLLAQNIPYAQKVVLPNAGHMANLDAPESFNRIVLDYLLQAD
jgi:pimeloyl-ACP methyl ester carboxylesterase